MKEDLNTQIMKHSGLVYSQLHNFGLIDDHDAESLAYEALYNALVDFDESKGTKFSTLATVYIYNALGTYTRSLKTKKNIQTVSYDNTAYVDDSCAHSFLEFFTTGDSVEDQYIRKEKCRLTAEVFNKKYAKLTNEKHKEILAIWRDSDFTATTTDISKQVGVSQSYVSQVINNFKYSLKKELEDVYYD